MLNSERDRKGWNQTDSQTDERARRGMEKNNNPLTLVMMGGGAQSAPPPIFTCENSRKSNKIMQYRYFTPILLGLNANLRSF